MNAPIAQPGRITTAQFLIWADEQASGRYELLDGEIIGMAPERVAHARRKLAICDRLRAAIVEAGVPRETIPDELVHCGTPIDGDEMLLPDPVIIVEVLSPSTRAVDLTYKLARCFQRPSLHHYLVARANTPAMPHHRRTGDGISVQIVGPGPLRLVRRGSRCSLIEALHRRRSIT